ncbi:MAG TPA: serine hydrolase domain-containing protein [Stellaceae bacterium]|nr:serine hydrolase domain-containing protein [Stellaceae bacterium]
MAGKWLGAALDYIPRWIEHQMRLSELPGCVVAIAERGRIVFDEAWGHADLARGVALTARHRFRVASHSKSFTAAGIMKLREQRRLSLDDPAGRYVAGLHPAVGRATIAQLLSHSAGIIRDGLDSGQWQDRRPFASEVELRAALAEKPVLAANTRFKYSNHAYGLAGLVIEGLVGEPYAAWIKRAIVDPAGLAETAPDIAAAGPGPIARGHSGKWPAGRRLVIPGDNPTGALAAATGFVATAADLARFFAQLDPATRGGVLSPASRREMIRRQWRDPQHSVERYYGLGIRSGTVHGWDWFGHSGGFQGFITRTAVLPEHGLCASILTNAADGLANEWIDALIHIMATFARHGAPAPRLADWSGRWWSLGGAFDLVPMGRAVLVADPDLPAPFADASELAIGGADRGRIVRASGTANHGESVRLVRDASGRPREFWLGGGKLLPEAAAAAELVERYGR